MNDIMILFSFFHYYLLFFQFLNNPIDFIIEKESFFNASFIDLSFK